MRVTDTDTLLRAYDEQMRGFRGRPGLIIEQDGPVLRVAGQHRGFVTTPRDLGVDGPELDALIARQRDYFALRGEAVEWKTRGHDLPASLTDRLRAAGFVPEDQETVVIGVTSDMAADPVVPNGTTLREVTADADLRAIAAMESTIWGEDLSFMGEELIVSRAAAPDEIAFFSVTDDATGQVVSAAWIIYHPDTDFAYLAGGSTLEAWRKRGIYHALVAVRAQQAVARGTRYLMVDASDDSAPILGRLGFTAVTTTTPYVWTPPGRLALLRTGALLYLAPAAGPVVCDDLPEHRGECRRVDRFPLPDGHGAGGLVVVSGGDDALGIGHDGAVIKEDVDMVFRGQQGADVALEHEIGPVRALDGFGNLRVCRVDQVTNLAADRLLPVRQARDVLVHPRIGAVCHGASARVAWLAAAEEH